MTQMYNFALVGNPPTQTVINTTNLPMTWTPSSNTLDFHNVNIVNLDVGSLNITTVSGTGTANYTTVVAALTALNGVGNIVVVGNTTETTGYTFPTGALATRITILPGITVNLQSTTVPFLSFTNSGSSGNVFIDGGGTINAPSQATPANGEIYVNAGAIELIITNIIFQTQSTNSHYFFNFNAAAAFISITSSGIKTIGALIMNTANTHLSDLVFVFVGALQPNAINISSTSMSNIRFIDGGTTGASTTNLISLSSSSITGCNSSLNTGYGITILESGNVTSFIDEGVGVNVSADGAALGAHITNLISSAGTLTIGSGANDFKVTNCTFANILTGTISSDVPEVITGCLFISATASEIECDYVRIQTCQFTNSQLQIFSTGVQVTNSDFGTPGAGTVANPGIFIESSASQTILTQCRLNPATSFATGVEDMGTGTQLSINSTW